MHEYETSIEYLSHYLPYKLMLLIGKDLIYNGSKLLHRKNDIIELKLSTLLIGLDFFNAKPILKPMANLYEDKEFISLCNNEIICGVWRFEKSYELIRIFTNDSVFLIGSDQEIAQECPYLFYEYLVKNHYDINNLIGIDMAINYNLLNE